MTNNAKLLLEPAIGTYANNITKYFFATRPAFLLAALAACLLGLASAKLGGVNLKMAFAVATILLALVVHAAVNVLNDYFDALSGADAFNTERVYPFTGGSRFIQNGLFTPQQTARFGYGLLLVAMLGGLWLVAEVGKGLLLIGGVGLFIGWAYSATPLSLNSRGLGEVCVLLGFLGVVIGADFVQRISFSWQPVFVGFPYALLVTNLLFINQFPDYKADKLAGKHHWVVRLPLTTAANIYPILVLLACVWLLAMALLQRLPAMTLWSALPLLFALRAAWLLQQHYAEPAKLRPAIQLTLLAMLGHALLLTLLLFWNAR